MITNIVLFAALLFGQFYTVPTHTGATAAAAGTTNHARTFNGTTSDTLISASALSSVAGITQLSLSFDAYINSYANDDHLLMESASGSTGWTTSVGGFVVDPHSSISGSSGTFMWSVSGAASGQYWLCYMTRPTAAAWHHYALTFSIAATPTCTAYVDGVSQTVTTQSINWTVHALTSNTLSLMSRSNNTLNLAGQISSIAIYSGIVNATDASSLAGCARPTSVTSATLLYYWPINQTSPEVATTGGINLNVTGTTNSASPCSF